MGRPRTASVSRKERAAKVISAWRMRRMKGVFYLGPRGERSGQSSTDISLAMTPALKKKMKLYSMTPQHSEVRML